MTRPVRRLLRLRHARSRIRPSKTLLVSCALGVVLLVAALIPDLLAPYGPTDIFAGASLQGPDGTHVFGTDRIGRDILSRLIYGSRTSLGIAIPSVMSALAMGLLIGLVVGYAGGWTDRIVMRLLDILFAFPAILLALALVAVLGPGPLNLIITIAILYMPRFAVICRAAALNLRASEFVEAAQSVGGSPLHIMRRHVLPNMMPLVIVETTLSMSAAILTEAALSFLGLGIQPPTPSWGAMLSDAQTYMTIAPWTIVFPGLAIMVAVLVLNLLGDSLRDRLDPRLRRLQ